MIQSQSYLNIADNSGAKKIMCIRPLKTAGKYAQVGDVIIAVVKETLPNMPVKKKDIVRAVIVRTRSAIKRSNGITLRFDDNAAILLNNANLPRGSRVFGPVARELREQNFAKIISLAPEVI